MSFCMGSGDERGVTLLKGKGAVACLKSLRTAESYLTGVLHSESRESVQVLITYRCQSPVTSAEAPGCPAQLPGCTTWAGSPGLTQGSLKPSWWGWQRTTIPSHSAQAVQWHGRRSESLQNTLYGKA